MSIDRRAKARVRQSLDESSLYVNEVAVDVKVFDNLHAERERSLDDRNPYVRKAATMPPPCPGSTLSSADISANAKHLRDDIIKDVKELTEPIKDSLSKLLAEMEQLRRRMGTHIDCKDASCQAESVWNINVMNIPTECSLNEPHYLNDENIDIFSTGVNSTEASVTDTDLKNEFEDEEQVTREKKLAVQPRHTDTDTLTASVTAQRQRIRFNNPEAPSNNVVFVTPRQKSNAHSRVHVVDERECLANAFQFHVEDIVSSVDFPEREVRHCLLADGCITDEECSSVQKLSDRKDRIRALLSLIKARDIRALREFMIHIERYDEDVAVKITRTFESNKSNGVNGISRCALCNLERYINVKHIADSLWSIQAIDDGIYSKIIYSDTPIGAQGFLWRKIFQSLNCLNPQRAELARKKLLNSLLSRNMFTHLVSGIDEMLTRNNGKFICTCEQMVKSATDISSVSLTSVKTTLSPYSSRRHSISIAEDATTHNWTITDVDHIGEIASNFETMPLDTPFRNGAGKTDTVQQHGIQTVFPKKPTIWKKSQSDIKTPKMLLQDRTYSEAPGTTVKPSVHDLTLTATLPNTTPPELPRRPVRSHTPIPNIPPPTYVNKIDDQGDHADKEKQYTGSSDSQIPPLPVKKNKNPEWRKGRQQDSYFV